MITFTIYIYIGIFEKDASVVQPLLLLAFTPISSSVLRHCPYVRMFLGADRYQSYITTPRVVWTSEGRARLLEDHCPRRKASQSKIEAKLAHPPINLGKEGSNSDGRLTRRLEEGAQAIVWL